MKYTDFKIKGVNNRNYMKNWLMLIVYILYQTLTCKSKPQPWSTGLGRSPWYSSRQGRSHWLACLPTNILSDKQNETIFLSHTFTCRTQYNINAFQAQNRPRITLWLLLLQSNQKGLHIYTKHFDILVAQFVIRF